MGSERRGGTDAVGSQMRMVDEDLLDGHSPGQASGPGERFGDAVEVAIRGKDLLDAMLL
jgi:hypothetical protein